MKKLKLLPLAGVAMAMLASNANALSWEGENYTGSFTSTLGASVAVRTASPGCENIATGATGSGAPIGCLSPGVSNDQGDLNYKKGKPMSEALRGTHELLLKNPDNDLTLMARYSWLSDFATPNPGISSGDGLYNGQPYPGSSKNSMYFHGILQDAWVAKGFDLNGEKARVKVGNQVMNWGESLFFAGGINGTNPMDYQRLATPGTLVKETLLAQPAINFSSAIGNGFSVETYYQFGYKPSYFSPVGSFWSTSYLVGQGSYNYNGIGGLLGAPATDGYYGLNNYLPAGGNAQGQFGGALRWQPESTQINVAAYFVNYHDKSPQVAYATTADGYSNGGVNLNYARNNKLFGLSANAPIGEWSVGTEVSYRPKDAISLNGGASYCGTYDYTNPSNLVGGNGQCYVNGQKYQAAINGAYTMTPSNSGSILSFLGASGGNVFWEYTGVYYPTLLQNYANGPVGSGNMAYGMAYNFLSTYASGSSPTATAVGTKYSAGAGLDLSVNYDNKIIEGWLVTPEIFYQRSLTGYTPNSQMQFMQGNSSVSAIVSFARNTGGWAAQLNYTQFMGGQNNLYNPYRDRSFLAASGSYTF